MLDCGDDDVAVVGVVVGGAVAGPVCLGVESVLECNKCRRSSSEQDHRFWMEGGRRSSTDCLWRFTAVYNMT